MGRVAPCCPIQPPSCREEVSRSHLSGLDGGALWCRLSQAVGQRPCCQRWVELTTAPHQNRAVILADALEGLFVLALLVALYFLPTFIAWERKVPNVGSIAVINTFLGWTLVGWVIALAMAARSVSASSASTGLSTGIAATPPALRECPNCKHAMNRGAGVCPNCGSESKPWTLHAGVWWVQRCVRRLAVVRRTCGYVQVVQGRDSEQSVSD